MLNNSITKDISFQHWWYLSMTTSATGNITTADGTEIWFVNKRLHREDGPAIIYRDGCQEWWVNGIRHNQNGPAVIWARTEEWWVDGARHKLDGPAVIHPDGTQIWYANGKNHRIDGPAIIYSNGRKEWWVNGNNITKEVKNWMKSKGYRWNKNSWKAEIISEFLLTFC